MVASKTDEYETVVLFKKSFGKIFFTFKTKAKLRHNKSWTMNVI